MLYLTESMDRQTPFSDRGFTNLDILTQVLAPLSEVRLPGKDARMRVCSTIAQQIILFAYPT
jgi:hypothetical protein